MAQEITTIPEKYEFDSSEMDSNIAENPCSSYRARRHSLSEKPDTTKRRVPIHLRASTGSCHDLCKFGKKHSSEEKTKEPFRKRISKSLPNEPISSRPIVSEPSRATASRSSPNESKHVKTTTSGAQNTKKPSDLVNISPWQSALSGNKNRSLNLSCSVSEQPPEIIKREILLSPSEKVEALVEEGSSNDNKMLRADKKTSDQTVNHSSSEKAKLFKTNKPLIASGRKATSSETSVDKASESLTVRLSSKLYLGKTTSSKAREKVGRVNLSLLSPVKHRNGTEKSNGEVSERTLHVIKTKTEENTLSSKARKNGGVKLSSPPSLAIGIHVIKTESESNASTSVSSPLSSSCLKRSLSSREEKDEYEEIQDTTSIKTEENHARAKPPSSSSHEDDDEEMIDHINNEAVEKIEDKIMSSEIKNHDTNPTLSSSCEDDDDKMINHSNNETDELIEDKIVSSEIKNHYTNPKLSSFRKDEDDKIDHSNNEAGELVEDKNISSEIKNHNANPTSSSSHEEEEEEGEEEEEEDDDDDDDDEEIYLSSSESSYHARSSSLSSLEENDEEINGELVTDKTISTDIGKSQFPKEIRTSLRKSRSIRTNDKNNRSPVKLKFRRGQIIDLQPENNAPKRLKFRRARNSDNNNKMDDFAPEGMKSVIVEMGNVKPGTSPNRTLRKADSFISDNKEKSTDIKPGTPNRSLSVTSEDKYLSPVSLSHREKTVDPQAGNNNPTRLKFTRGRAPRVEDAKSDLWRKSIKKVGGNTGAVGFEASSSNVVLKHPEVQRKNNGQVLLNNVIEETACKLVESRKSKVKALVGAFETVISLHETKPAASSHAVG